MDFSRNDLQRPGYMRLACGFQISCDFISLKAWFWVK
jgi:hypothetical protein